MGASGVIVGMLSDVIVGMLSDVIVGPSGVIVGASGVGGVSGGVVAVVAGTAVGAGTAFKKTPNSRTQAKAHACWLNSTAFP